MEELTQKFDDLTAIMEKIVAVKKSNLKTTNVPVWDDSGRLIHHMPKVQFTKHEIISDILNEARPLLAEIDEYMQTCHKIFKEYDNK